MRILVLASRLEARGGIQAYNRKLIAALADGGEEVRPHQLADTSLGAKIRFAVLFLLQSLIWKPDLVVVTNINFAPLAYFSYLAFRRPYTVTVYGIEVAPIRTALQKRALAGALFVVKLFDQAERDVVCQIPALKGRFVPIPNSIDGERFTVLKKKSDALAVTRELIGKSVVLTICRLSVSERDNKGYVKVIEAFPEVLKEVSEARYLLVGDGDDRAAMIALVHQLGLEGKVILPGAAEDKEMEAYYNLADVFVYVSKREGFPAIVLLEALVCGTPVVCGNQPDAIRSPFDGQVGLVVDPDDRKALAKAIIAVLKHHAPAHFYDRSALRRTVLEAYGSDAYSRRVASFLERVRSELHSRKEI